MQYDHDAAETAFLFKWSDPQSDYLRRLRKEADLDRIVADCTADLDRCSAICQWANGLWEHNGGNEPKKNDPLSILEEVKQGKRFRCVEYAIVINGCLNAIGIPSRVLGLKTSDVETRRFGAGHVVAEVFLRDQQRWCFIDGQWSAIPMLKGKPLSAVEFQEALTRNDTDLEVRNTPASKAASYFQWVRQYLYYLDTRLDTRVGEPGLSHAKVMLTPIGAKQPAVFQRRSRIDNTRYTVSASAFYPIPRGATTQRAATWPADTQPLR